MGFNDEDEDNPKIVTKVYIETISSETLEIIPA